MSLLSLFQILPLYRNVYIPLVSTKEVVTFTDKPPNTLAQPVMLMDALEAYQLNPVPTRGHAKAQAEAAGVDLCGGSHYSCLRCCLPEDK